MILEEAVICHPIPAHFGKQRDKENGKETYYTKEVDGVPACHDMLCVVGQCTFLH